MIFSALALSAAAKAGGASDITASPAVKVCANKGNWQNAPENSIKAINDCTCDFVSVDVKLTADGVPVLMEDETVSRTCASDKNGKAVDGRVSEMKSADITGLYLRNKNGGINSTVTDETVPTLENVLAKTDKTLILDFSLEALDAVYDTVSSASASQRVIFRIDGDKDDIISAVSKKEKLPEIILKYDGSIIFSVISTINAAKESGLQKVQIGSKNQYGVIFYDSVKNKIRNSSLEAVFSMTDGYNAKRGDNTVGWDDVISHGYSIIETDYPELLSAYVKESEALRQKITELLKESAEEYDFSDGIYSENLIKKYKTAVEDTEALLETAASESQLAEAYTKLNIACNELRVNDGAENEISAKLNFSAGRIIAAVLCLAAVVAAQIYFVKRRKK